MGISSSQPDEAIETKPGLLVAVQTRAVLGQVEENLVSMEEVLVGLPDAPDRLVVFPEMGISGYFFGDRERLWELSEDVPEGPISQQLIALAAKYNCYLVAGLPERQGKALYNCAVLVGPEGYIAKYRKLHLWDEEKLLYDPGDLGLVMADTPIGRIGLIICYDLWFPEQARILRLMGADVIAMPAALVWNDTPGHVKRGYYMADYVAMVTAHLNQVYLAMASQVGRDDEHWLFGSSVLVSPYGWPLVEPAGDDELAVLYAQVDFTLGRKLRGWSSMDHFDLDRRTDVYGRLLGYADDQEVTS
jgi:predicted amidohydrolase